MSYELGEDVFMELIDNYLKVCSNEFEDNKLKRRFEDIIKFSFVPYMFGSGFFFGTHDHRLAEIYIKVMRQKKRIIKLTNQIKKLKENK